MSARDALRAVLASVRELWRGDWLVEAIDGWLIRQHQPLEIHAETSGEIFRAVCPTCRFEEWPCREFTELIETRARHRLERHEAQEGR